MRAMSRDIRTTKPGSEWGRRAMWLGVAVAGVVGLIIAMAGLLTAQVPQNGLRGSMLPQGFEPLDPALLLHSPPIFGTHYKAYGGSAFQPFYGDTYNNTGMWDGLYSLGTDFPFYVTRLDLPQTATLTEVEFYYIDNDGTDLFFVLEENDVSVNAPGPGQVTGSSSGASPAIQKEVLSFSPISVDNTRYST